jgi:ankyrin repeat protein
LSFTLPISAQADPDFPFPKESIPQIDSYFKSIEIDDVAGVKKSLEFKDLSVNTLSKYGDAPLPFAVKSSSYKVFKYLLQIPDINVNFENSHSENALMLCALNGDLESVKYLVEVMGAEIEKDGWTPLHYAATKGNLNVVEYLVAKEADVNVESPNKLTPLMLAAKYGYIRVVKFLLDHEADLSMTNYQGQTAIDLAAAANQKEIADGLKSRWKKIYGKDYLIDGSLKASK